MTRIVILRHGETLWNRAGRMQGQTDVPLSDLGVEQARIAAEELADDHFDAIWSSPLQRASVTAQAVADKLGMPVHLDARLGEIDVGDWSGKTGADVGLESPERAIWYHEGRDYRRSATGETATEAAERGEAAIRDIVEAYPDGSVLVVAHGYFTQLLLSRLVGLEGFGNRFRALRNARRAEIIWEHGHWSLVAYNVGQGCPTT